MPKGYVIFTEDVTDREKMNAYSADAALSPLNFSTASSTTVPLKKSGFIPVCM